MKSILIAVFCLIAVSCNTQQVFDRSAGSIHLSVDAKGRVTTLEDVEGQVNYIAPDEPTYLIGCSMYEADSASAVMYPVSAELVSYSEKESLIRLSFPRNVKLDVKINACENYFRMELAGSYPLSEIRMISWGPYHTTMKGLFGEWLGLNRSNDFTLGLLTLEPNTDGDAARHTPYGSEMQLVSYDHTRGMFVGKDFRLRNAAPIPGRTVIGSAVALFGCRAGRDNERGFRGTMLDYRLYRQLQLSRNLMPYKMGQYYPDNATADDVRWLMALLAGWDSGVDFSFGLDNFRKNPEYDLILETFRLWEKARDENAFTEEQKMQLRQTDVLYNLSQDQDGKWLLEFDRRWLYDKINILTPNVMNACPADDNTISVRPCSIDWTWTHNPGIYNEAGLSDDLIHLTGEKSTSWNIDLPAYEESKRSHYPTSDRNFQFVIRVPEDAPCPVRNFRITVDDQVVYVPVTLNPGQYISTPHIMELACIYNSDHRVAGEVYLHGKLPRVFKGKTSAVCLSCEPVEKGAITEVIMNARFQNGYFHIY